MRVSTVNVYYWIGFFPLDVKEVRFFEAYGPRAMTDTFFSKKKQ
jgi:hypothetical protein